MPNHRKALLRALTAALVMLALLPACVQQVGSEAAIGASAEFRYKPPLVPIIFSIDSSLNISVSLAPEVVTPLGVFTAVGSATVDLEGEDDWIIELQLDNGPVHAFRVYSETELVIEAGPNRGVVIAASERRFAVAVTGAQEVVVREAGGETMLTPNAVPDNDSAIHTTQPPSTETPTPLPPPAETPTPPPPPPTASPPQEGEPSPTAPASTSPIVASLRVAQNTDCVAIYGVDYPVISHAAGGCRVPPLPVGDDQPKQVTYNSEAAFPCDGSSHVAGHLTGLPPGLTIDLYAHPSDTRYGSPIASFTSNGEGTAQITASCSPKSTPGLSLLFATDFRTDSGGFSGRHAVVLAYELMSAG